MTPENQYLIDVMTVKDTWRLFKVLAELVDGFETLSEFYPCISIFGSARVRPGDETYEKTVEIARKLSENGFHIITGNLINLVQFGASYRISGISKTLPFKSHLSTPN